jgi:NAD(P)-dependent dehydrogenase (short-subunit alcohol dehydrogenase family)
MDLKGKVAIITGVGGGIGRGIALKFGSLGAQVVVADIKLEGARETVSMLEKGGHHCLHQNHGP